MMMQMKINFIEKIQKKYAKFAILWGCLIVMFCVAKKMTRFFDILMAQT